MTLDIKNDPPASLPESTPGDDWPHEPNVLVHGGFIRAMIALVVILVLGMVSLIFIRAQAVDEPTAAVLLSGDKYLADAVISVLADGRPIVKTHLVADYEWSAPILVTPGGYEVVVTLHDEEILRAAVAIPHQRVRTLDLPTSVLINGNEALAGAKVTLSGGEPYRSDTIALALDNDQWRAMFHRAPGHYHLSITRAGKILRDLDFTLNAHRPKVIDLYQPRESDQASIEGK